VQFSSKNYIERYFLGEIKSNYMKEELTSTAWAKTVPLGHKKVACRPSISKMKTRSCQNEVTQVVAINKLLVKILIDKLPQ
jgi:hypothetical protein